MFRSRSLARSKTTRSTLSVLLLLSMLFSALYVQPAPAAQSQKQGGVTAQVTSVLEVSVDEQEATRVNQAVDPRAERSPWPAEYCTSHLPSDPVQPQSPPTPFMYQPFTSTLDSTVWSSQMDHSSPNYTRDGASAILGEKLSYSEHYTQTTGDHPRMEGGTKAWSTEGVQSFISYATKPQSVLPKGLFYYQSRFFAAMGETRYLGYEGHDGHDFATRGDALAAAGGQVVYAGDTSTEYGNVVEIYHPEGYLTRYAHLNKWYVNGGAPVARGRSATAIMVTAGQAIGQIGNTGHGTGTHLHFMVFRWNDSLKKWRITDPFGWDPWASPSDQRRDPLVSCNGEISYNLWFGWWPRRVSTTQTATTVWHRPDEAFRPTDDRYVGGAWDGTTSSQSSTDNAAFVQDMTLPDPPPYVVNPGQSYTKTWRVRNTGTSTWNSNYKLVFRNGDQFATTSQVNVPGTVAPGQTVDISVPLTIPANKGAGTYQGNWQLRNPQGTYFGDTIYYSLQISSPQPPSGNGVNVELVGITLPNGGQVSPGQTFQPQVTVKVTSGQLLESRGHLLLFKSGTNYTNPEFRHVAVQGTVNPGQNHTFTFYQNNPFKAPNTPGVYESTWQVWANNGWAGPEIDIRFNVYVEDTGRKPNAPSNVSPYDWAVLVGQNPQLCVQHNGDPDGDAITNYHFLAWNSVSPTYDSGWVSSNCVNTSNLEYQGYTWHAQVRDSRNQVSDWGPDWHFGVQSSTVSFTDIHFDPGSPSNAQTVVCYACTSGCAGVGVELQVWVNTAADGSANGQWKEIKTLGVPCFTANDAPRWDTLDYADGVHKVRFQAKSCDGTIVTQERNFTLNRRQPSRPFLEGPSHDFWSNSRTITFSWQAAMRATGYRLVAGTSPNLTQNLVLDVPVNGTSYTHTFDQDYSRLYWGVYASNELGTTDQLGRILGIDRTAPASAINTTRTTPVVYEPQFTVSWDGSDANSGVRSYDVQYRIEPNGQWTDWLLDYPNTSAILSGQPGFRYSLRSRARDIAGNVEQYPATADAQVLVDPAHRPPQVWWNTAYAGKRNLVVNNPLANVPLPAGYTVQLHFDGSTSPTAAEIYNASVSPTKGDDVRVLYNNQVQVARQIRTFTSSQVDILFAAQAPIAPSSSSVEYQLYYGNASPGAPPANLGSVHVPGVDSNTRAAWYYEDANGTADSSGNGYNISWQNPGSVSMSYGLQGQGVRLTRSPAGYAPGNPIGDYLTAETWVYFEGPTLPSAMYTELLNKRNPENNGDRWGIRLQTCGGNNTPCLRGSIEVLNPNPFAFGLDWDGPVLPDVWYHIAITYDGNVGRLWVNGQNVHSRSAPNGRVRDDGQAINIGRTSQLNWRIDATRISNTGRPSFDYGKVTTRPSAAAGQHLTHETIGPSNLALHNLDALPNPGGGILLQAVFQNEGEYPTYNEFYTHVYTEHVPTGTGDLTNSIGFWINAPVAPGESVTLTNILSDTSVTALSASKVNNPAAGITERTYNFSAQLDSTGSTNDASRANNVVSGIQYCTASVDTYEPDNKYEEAKTLSVGASQVHNIDKADDEDWVRFQAQAGKTYNSATSGLATGADTYLYLYGTDGETLLTSNDDYNDTLASYIEWTAPATGSYYLLVRHWNPSAEGCGQSYMLNVALQPENTATPTLTATPTNPVPPGTTATRTPPAGATSTPRPTVVPGTCSIQFTDVPSTNNFYPYVRCLACREVLGGYTDPSRCPETGAPCFRPGDPITRGQMAKIVSNAAGFNEAHSDISFTDVGTDHTFYIFIQRLASRGVVGGYNDLSKCPNGAAPCFLPGALVTRGQMSKFVAEAADFNEVVPLDTHSFSDVAQTDTFWVYIELLYSRGVVSGYPCGAEGEGCPGLYFRPGANVTRGQASKFVSLAFYPNCQTPSRN
jgi:murein DD-endopeptidase MepM/ murein hydrolase activator NlpD